MGLTGGVKSHRLSGQISPYCEKKKGIGSARIARLCFNFCSTIFHDYLSANAYFVPNSREKQYFVVINRETRQLRLTIVHFTVNNRKIHDYYSQRASRVNDHGLKIAFFTNLRSGSIFVSLGETFRREGRNEK